MLCPSCRMDSRTTNVCEWCHKSLAGGQAGSTARPLSGHSAAAPLDLTQPIPAPLDQTQPIPPTAAGVGAAGNVRMSLTGEVVEVAPPAPSVLRPTPGMAAPPHGHHTQAVVHGLPPGAVSPALMRPSAPRATAGEKWEKCLAIIMPFLLASVVLLHFVPTAFAYIALVDLFVAGLAMGATGAIDSYDDAYLDCGVVLLVCAFFGPLIALGVYLIVGLMKQEWNASILWLLFGHLMVRLILIVSFASEADTITLLPQMMMLSFMGFLTVCASFAGWILSSFFRPLNE